MIFLFGSQVFWHELRSCLQGLSLFHIDPKLAFLSASSGLCIGHAEDVVCYDSSVNTAVARNRLTQLGSLVTRSLNSVENSKCIFVFLRLWPALSALGQGLVCLSSSAKGGLLFDDLVCLFKRNTVELVNSFGWNGLNNDHFFVVLPFCMCPLLSEHRRSERLSQPAFRCALQTLT